MVVLQTKDNDMFQRRFRGGSSASQEDDQTNTTSSTSSSGSSSQQGSDLGSDRKASIDGFANTSSRQFRKGVSGSTSSMSSVTVAGSHGRHAVSEAIDQSELLKRDLARVSAGLTLLGQSVEKLHEVVAVDTTCFGGLFTNCCASFFSPSIHMYQQAGYNRVQSDALDDSSGHDRMELISKSSSSSSSSGTPSSLTSASSEF